MTLLDNQMKSLIEQYGATAVMIAFNKAVDMSINEMLDLMDCSDDDGTERHYMTGMELMLHEAMHSDWDSAWNRAADMVINDGIRWEDEHYNAPDIAAAVEYARHTRIHMTGMELMRATVGYHNLPYPFCRHPEDCDGRGYCRHDPACND